MGMPQPLWLNQRAWRTIGAVALLAAAGMAWYGSEHAVRDVSVLFMAVYWGIFSVCLLVAMYMALIDLRYIRVQYLMGQRDIYLDTMGDEALREALRKRGPGAKNDGEQDA